MRKIFLINNLDNENFDLPEQIVELVSEQDLISLETQTIAFFLIDGRSPTTKADEIVKNIRNQFKPGIYLRPIVVIVNDGEEVLAGVDSVITVTKMTEPSINELISHYEPVNQWIDKSISHSNVPDSGYVFRILRLIVSRATEFVPKTSLKKLSGYSYPLLDLVGEHENSGLFQALEFLESQKLISGRFVTKAHFCCHCDSAFLNFKEVCPQCSSDHLTSHELIHHFKCSYVGEMPEYQNGDELVCPKCDKKLKHIGVDYDKPSVVHRCNQCNNRFQEAIILTQCFNCGRSTEPENQVLRSIKAYKSTAIGNNAAIYGMDSLFSKVLEPKFNLFSTKDFRRLLFIERERIHRYNISSSSLVFIQFDIEQIYIEFGSKAQEFFAELSEVFKSILRNSDVISSQNESLFVLLLLETSAENSKIALSRFEEGVNKLFIHNLGNKLAFSSHIEEVKHDTELDKSIENFLTN